MARKGWEDGIRTVVATPHLFWGQRLNRYADVRKLASEAELFLKEHDVPMRILPGMEVPTQPKTLQLLKSGPLPTLGESVCLLLEPPFGGIPHDMPEYVERLTQAGYRLLLAHPERCRSVQERPDCLDAVFPPDLPIQLTSHSLVGEFGPSAQETAVRLLSSGRPIILASDSHASHRRIPGLRDAAEVAARVVGTAYAHQMVTDLPMALLEDRPVWPP